MIAVETTSGELIKVIRAQEEDVFGFHKLFGLVGDKTALKRLHNRKINGHEFDKDEWLCKFKINNDNGSLSFSDLDNCKIEKKDDSIWNLSATHGDFVLKHNIASTIADELIIHEDKASWLNGVTEKILFLIFAIIPLLLFLQSPSEEEKIEEKKEKKPITVKIIKRPTAVNVSQKNPSIKVKPLTQAQKSKRAVKRNLGFLGLVGSKDLTKAVGGTPQKLKKASAGAGAGGSAGSGGELITGLGKGLKKTTVGNTGVAGLGGIGTKGAGGGAGGYGNTMVASGEGEGISSISMASNDLVLEGGLSKYAINATIAKYLSQVRRCYEARLNKVPGIEGQVTVSFQINANGMLNFAKVANSTLNDSVVESCMTKKMMSWKFPRPKGGVNVNINYPFMLRPVGT